MLFSARFGAVAHIRSFLNLKFDMALVHLKIEKYRISRPRPIGGSDLVLTEWTPRRKSTHKMKNRSSGYRFPEILLQFYSACGAPMPCAAGSSIALVHTNVQFPHLFNGGIKRDLIIICWYLLVWCKANAARLLQQEQYQW